jgi:hypothetical protein
MSCNPCGVVGKYRRFRGTYFQHLQPKKKKNGSFTTQKTKINFCSASVHALKCNNFIDDDNGTGRYMAGQGGDEALCLLYIRIS